MQVDTDALRSGANVSDEAGGHAHAGAQRLRVVGLTAGMFGDFGAAHDFHSALGTAKDAHHQILLAHHESLTVLADDIRTAADAFTAMDDENAQSMREVIARPPS